jgi:hypothetical protein
MDQKITVTFSHSCDNCGSDVTDRDQILCDKCRSKIRVSDWAIKDCLNGMKAKASKEASARRLVSLVNQDPTVALRVRKTTLKTAFRLAGVFESARAKLATCPTPGCLGGDNHSSRCTDG